MAKCFELKCNTVSQKRLLPELPDIFFDKITYSVGKEMQRIKPISISARPLKHSTWDIII